MGVVMLIRPCVERDMPQLLEIWLQATLHEHDYLPVAGWWPREEAMRRTLQHDASIWVVAEEREAETELMPLSMSQPVVGFVATREDQLLALYVHPAYQRRGLGSLLMALAKEQHEQLRLSVCSRNAEAVQFYLQQGFVICGEQYRDDEQCDEYLMQFPIS